MKITADLNCYLTEVAEVSLEKRTFKSMVIVSSPEEAAKWKQITAEEKASLEAQAAIFNNQEITPEYLQQISTLIAGIREHINDTPMSAEDALANKGFFPDFDSIIGREINTGFRFNCGTDMYEALVPHKVSEEHRPVTKAVLLDEAGEEETQLYKLVTKD